VRRLVARTVELAEGSVTSASARVGGGKSASYGATLLSTPARLPGSLSLYPNDRGTRARGKYLGGTVALGGGLDERFVAFAADPAEAAAVVRALDLDAVDALLHRLRSLGARRAVAFGAAPGRASVLVEGTAPDALLVLEAARETLLAIRRCVRGG
jgi:hypothetical protein